MEVSVVIPTFNRAGQVCEAIASCLEQSLMPGQIVVVDDASTDDTAEVLREWLVQNGFDEELGSYVNAMGVRIDYRRFPRNRGPAAARNEGLKLVDADFVAFLDSDDLLTPGSLAKRAEFLAANADIGLVFGDTMHVEADGVVQTASFFNQFGIRDRLTLAACHGGWRVMNAFDAFLLNCEILTPQVMVRMVCIRDIEWFDETLRVAEDRECWARWAARFPFGMIDEVVAKVRLGTGNQLTKNNDAAWDEAMAYVERKRLRSLPLTAKQKAEIKQRYSRRIFNLAYLHFWHQNKKSLALWEFTQSFFAKPSLKAVKCIGIVLAACLGLITPKRRFKSTPASISEN